MSRSLIGKAYGDLKVVEYITNTENKQIPVIKPERRRNYEKSY
jgi:hypothetical protein